MVEVSNGTWKMVAWSFGWKNEMVTVGEAADESNDSAATTRTL